MMKTKLICLSRSDFRDSSDCNFFDDILQRLEIPESDWSYITLIDLEVSNFTL